MTRADAPGTAQRQSWVPKAATGEGRLMFQLLFLSGNPSLPAVQCGGPRGNALPSPAGARYHLRATCPSLSAFLVEGSIF